MILPWLLCLILGSYLLNRAQSRRPRLALGPAATVLGAPREFLFSLRGPLAGERIVARGETVKVRFRWSVKRSDDSPIPRNFPAALLLELSPKRDFPPEKTETTRLPSLVTSELGEYLPRGRYYWRLRIGTGILSETREFRVVSPGGEP